MQNILSETPGKAGAATSLAVSFLMLSMPGYSGTQPPTIKLFPTTVLEEIKHTGSVAKEMETGLQSVIARLDQQQQLYLDSKCEGGKATPAANASRASSVPPISRC